MSTSRRAFFLFYFIFAGYTSWSQSFSIEKDLHSQWRVYENNKYENYTARDNDDVSSIYFLVDGDKFSGDYLHVKSTSAYSLFVNGKLAFTGNEKLLSVDSLAKVFRSTSLHIAIHRNSIRLETLQTLLEKPGHGLVSTPQELANKPATFFHDFAVVALLTLLILLIAVISLNPKLTADYFSITKIFSMRESEDNQIYSRITSSTNILFYVFSSLVLGFYLMIIFHFITPYYISAYNFQADSFAMTVVKWIELSLIILGIFFLKLILVYISSILFGARDMAGVHFFNWVRLLLIFFGVMSVVLFANFVWHGQSFLFYVILFKLMAWILAGWVFIILLKLNRKTGFSLFHLFSYICATEIIPLLVIIAVLYN
jgi:hypothetical protein